MKKIILFFIITVNANVFSNTNMIVFTNLPQNNKYLDQVKYLYENVYLVNTFYEKWTFEEPKEEIIDRVKKLINETEEIIKTEEDNYDLELYLHLLMHYLYNLNIYDYKEFNYNHFREALGLVFEINGYKEHYQKMVS